MAGPIRRFAYARFSEARAAHWLLLLAADRVDAGEHHVRSMFTLRPDNPITQTGVRSELTHHGPSSRFGRSRADLTHVWLDPLLVAKPWMVSGGLVVGVVMALRKRG